MELSDYAQALGAAQQLIPAWDEPQRRRVDLQGAQLQNQQAQMQIAAAQQQQQDGAAFQSALSTLPPNPTAQQYRQLATRFPRFFKPISEVADGMDAQHKTQTVSHLSQIGAAIAANKPDLAIAQVQRHIDADKAAGNAPDEDDLSLVKMLQSGDPEQVKAAGVLVHGTLAGLDPKTAEAMKPDDGDHFASTGDNAIYDKRTGKIIREGVQKPEYRTIKNADGSESIVAVGSGSTEGGGQASGGAGAASGSVAPSVRTQYGWTPRKRNGGDNDDAAVDGKIAGMSKALGIAPNAPLDGMSNMQIAQALTLSEGGPGSIADRRNNPGNLTDPKTGDYRYFKTKQEGLAAAAAQVARNRARGQNTIQTMVEGLPVKGNAAPSGTSNARVLFTSTGDGGVSDFRLLSTQEKRDKGLDPGSQFQVDAKGKITPLGRKTELTEGERKATGLLAAMVAASGSLNAVRGYRPSAVALALNDLSNKNPVKANLSQVDRRVLNGQLAFANAILRLESGAAIGKDETANKAQTLFPMPGDGPEVQADKRAQREAALRSMRIASGAGSESIAATARAGNGRQGAVATASPPPGGKLIGLYQGRQVFQLANGKRVVAR